MVLARKATLGLEVDARGAKRGASEFDQATGRIKKSAGSADKAVRRLVSGIALLAVARSAARTIASFESEMATLGVVTGATAKELEQLSATARKMGATTRFSATQAAEGLTFLARAGFSADKAMKALPATLNLAAASGMGLGQAADLASNVLGQFGLEAQQTERVVDALLRTSNQANTNVEQLGEAMKMAGPIAGALGRSIEETSVAIGVLGDRGIQASMAGVNLRQIMLSLLGPTPEAARAIERMGLSLEALDPRTNTIVDIFRRFRQSGLDAASAMQIFQTRNAGAALILSQSAEQMEKNIAAQMKMANASDAAAKMNDTLKGSILGLESAWKEMFLAGGDKGLLGSLRSVVDLAKELVQAITGASGAVGQLGERSQRFAAGFGYLLGKALGDPEISSHYRQLYEQSERRTADFRARPDPNTIPIYGPAQPSPEERARFTNEQYRLARRAQIGAISGPPEPFYFGPPSMIPAPGGRRGPPGQGSSIGFYDQGRDMSAPPIGDQSTALRDNVDSLRMMQTAATGVVDAFFAITQEGRDVSDTLKAMAREISQQVLRQAVSDAVASGFGGRSP